MSLTPELPSQWQANDASEDLEAIQGQRSQIVGMAGALPTLRDVTIRWARCTCVHAATVRVLWEPAAGMLTILSRSQVLPGAEFN